MNNQLLYNFKIIERIIAGGDAKYHQLYQYFTSLCLNVETYEIQH